MFTNDSVVQMVDPDHLDLNPLPPPVHIEQVLAQGHSYSVHESTPLAAAHQVTNPFTNCAAQQRLKASLVYKRTVYRIAFSVLHDEADAEDAVQQVCVNAYLKLHNFRMESRFGTWFIGIVLNEARRLLRQRKRMTTQSLDSPMEYRRDLCRVVVDSQNRPIKWVLQQEIQMYIHGAISQLPTIYRDVFQLRELEGHSVRESAKKLGASEAVIKVRFHRVRLMLQRHLAAQYRSSFAFDTLD